MSEHCQCRLHTRELSIPRATMTCPWCEKSWCRNCYESDHCHSCGPSLEREAHELARQHNQPREPVPA